MGKKHTGRDSKNRKRHVRKMNKMLSQCGAISPPVFVSSKKKKKR